MENILKPVPGIDDLEINYDGTIILFRGKIKNIHYVKKGRKRYKFIYCLHKRYSIGKLVYRAWIGEFPSSRNIFYIDGFHLNTHYKNLGPRPAPFKDISRMVKVPGYDDLWVNSNGTVLEQYGKELNITFMQIKKKTYRIVTISGPKGAVWAYVHKLVAAAFLNAKGKNKIIHIDRDYSNNYFKNLQVLSEREYKKHLNDLLAKNREIRGSDSIPKDRTEEVKRRLLGGETLDSIATEFNCSDMSISRFKKRHFTKRQIDIMNKNNGVVVKKLSKEVRQQIIDELKLGVRQIEVSQRFGVTPQSVCRINRKYIKTQETPPEQ